jgi:hypothetical protein
VSFASTRLIIAADGKVVFPGIDYSGAKLELHWQGGHEGKRLLVVKMGGTMSWASIGEREYVPARFAVYRVTGPPRRGQAYLGFVGTEYPVEQVIEFPIKKEAR